MKKVFCFLVLFLISHYATAQSEDQLDQKYVAAILYLKTNDTVKQQLSSFNNKWLKKNKVKNRENVDFNLCKFISHIDFPVNKIQDSLFYITFSEELLPFEKYENLLLKKRIINQLDSKIYLLFSKPIGNYLVSEFIITDYNTETDIVDFKSGPVLNLLFEFDKSGLIKRVSYSGYYYN